MIYKNLNRILESVERFVDAFERLAAAVERAYPPAVLFNPQPVHIPANTIPQVPYPPTVGDPPGWPSYPRITCGVKLTQPGNAMSNRTGMTQADGQGEDSGTRGD